MLGRCVLPERRDTGFLGVVQVGDAVDDMWPCGQGWCRVDEVLAVTLNLLDRVEHGIRAVAGDTDEVVGDEFGVRPLFQLDEHVARLTGAGVRAAQDDVDAFGAVR